MSALVLADAIEALISPDLNVFTDAAKLGERDTTTANALPWVVLRVHLPNHLPRALAGTKHGATVTIRTTIAGSTGDSVRVIYDRLVQDLEGARPRADGWRTSPIRETFSTDIAEDPDVTLIESNRHVVFSVVDWTLTVSRT